MQLSAIIIALYAAVAIAAPTAINANVEVDKRIDCGPNPHANC